MHHGATSGALAVAGPGPVSANGPSKGQAPGAVEEKGGSGGKVRLWFEEELEEDLRWVFGVRK